MLWQHGFSTYTCLPASKRQDRDRRVPMVGRGDRHGVDRWIVENAAEVADRLRAARHFDARRQPLLVDVANVHDLRILERRERSKVGFALIPTADHADPYALRGARRE